MDLKNALINEQKRNLSRELKKFQGMKATKEEIFDCITQETSRVLELTEPFYFKRTGHCIMLVVQYTVPAISDQIREGGIIFMTPKIKKTGREGIYQLEGVAFSRTAFRDDMTFGQCQKYFSSRDTAVFHRNLKDSIKELEQKLQREKESLARFEKLKEENENAH